MDRSILLGGLLLSLLLAIFLSPFASPWPDGLERVAEDKGFIELAEIQPVVSSPAPDYVWPGIRNERLATSIACLVGALMLCGLGIGLGYLFSNRNDAS